MPLQVALDYEKFHLIITNNNYLSLRDIIWDSKATDRETLLESEYFDNRLA